MPTTQLTLIIGREFGPKIVPLIKRAKNSIDIVVYDWRWYPDQIGSEIQKFNNAIIDTQKRGKKVRVIVNSRNVVYVLSANKVEVRKLSSYRKVHTKLLIIDDDIAILGSHNYTMNAFTINYEVSVIIQDKEIVKRLKSYFENLWSF